MTISLTAQIRDLKPGDELPVRLHAYATAKTLAYRVGRQTGRVFVIHRVNARLVNVVRSS